MELEKYRLEAQEFLESYIQARNDFHAGLAAELQLEPIFTRHERLFRGDSIASLLALHESANGEAKRRLRYLLEFAVKTALSRHVHREDEQISAILAREVEVLDGEELDYQAATVRIGNEPDPDKRQALHQVMEKLQGRTDSLRLGRLRRIHELARELTGMPYLECMQSLLGANFHLLKQQIEAFLEASRDRYQRDLALYAARHLGGKKPEETSAADLRYLLRGQEFDGLFPADRLLSVLKRTLMGIGIDLKKQTHIRIDAEERKGKHAAAACFGIRVPSRIYLVLRPHGGLRDYLALLRRAGHALHLGHVGVDQPFEYKYLGDAAVSETYGALFQYLTLNPEWLRDLVGIERHDDLVQFARFRKLFWLRCYAARFLYEMELHLDAGYEIARLKQRYSDLLGSALSLQVGGEDFLAEVEDPFYGTAFLRAWIFEAELRQNVEERYGPRWYSRPAAGGFLKDLWGFGTRYTVEELAKHIRLLELDLAPLERDLT